MEKSSEIICSFCNQKILDNKIYYCSNCKIFLEEKCAKIHKENSKHILLDENIFNFCIEDNSKFRLRCIKCNKSLCQYCNLDEHDAIEESHRLMLLSDLIYKKMILKKLNRSLENKKCFLKK